MKKEVLSIFQIKQNINRKFLTILLYLKRETKIEMEANHSPFLVRVFHRSTRALWLDSSLKTITSSGTIPRSATASNCSLVCGNPSKIHPPEL